MPSSFAPSLEEMLARVERAAQAIEQGGQEIVLHDLRLALIDVMCLIERNPGIEAAAQDLYDAASAFASDAQQSKRRLRVLRDARVRFRERLTRAH